MPLLERSKLYKDVWSRPCTKIAAELGISSSALKQICTEMDIPRWPDTGCSIRHLDIVLKRIMMRA